MSVKGFNRYDDQGNLIGVEKYDYNSLDNIPKDLVSKTTQDLVNYYKKSESYTKDEVNALVTAIPKFSIKVVDTLPKTGISVSTVYLLRSGEEASNLYTEYIFITDENAPTESVNTYDETAGVWEYLGTQVLELDWDNISNKPFHSEIVNEFIYLEDNEVSFHDNGTYYSSDSNGFIRPENRGEVTSYQVTFDGEIYDLMLKEERDYFYLGNKTLIPEAGEEFDFTSEPFVIVVPKVDDTFEPLQVMHTHSSEPTHNISVKGLVEKIVTIPEKYLPKDFISSSGQGTATGIGVTPQMYGAKGDGVTDDTEAFERALAESGNLFLPKGTYKISRPLDLTYKQTLVGDDSQSANILYTGESDSVVLVGRQTVFRNINIIVENEFSGVVFDTHNMNMKSSKISGMMSRVEHVNVSFKKYSPEATLIGITVDSGTDENNIPLCTGICFQTYNDILIDTGRSEAYGYGIKMTLVQGRPFTEETKTGFPWLTHIDYDDIYLGCPHTAIKTDVVNNSGSEHFNRIGMGQIMFNNVYTQNIGYEKTRYFFDVAHMHAYLTKCIGWDYHHTIVDYKEKVHRIGEGTNLSLNDCEMASSAEFLRCCEFPDDKSGFTVEENPAYFIDKYFKGTFLRDGYDSVDCKIDSKLTDGYVGDIAERKMNEILYSGYTNVLEDQKVQYKVGYYWSGSSQAWKEASNNTAVIIPIVKGGNVIRWTPLTYTFGGYGGVYLFNDDELTIASYAGYVQNDGSSDNNIYDAENHCLLIDNPAGYKYVAIPFAKYTDISAETMVMTINRDINGNNDMSYIEYLKEKVVVPTVKETIDYVTPQLYGAKGDGVTDDTEALKTALKNHAEVFLPEGTYLITQPIDLTNEKSLYSDNQKGVILYKGSGSIFEIGLRTRINGIKVIVESTTVTNVFDTDNRIFSSSQGGLMSEIHDIEVYFAGIASSYKTTLINIIASNKDYKKVSGFHNQHYSDIRVSGQAKIEYGIKICVSFDDYYEKDVAGALPWITNMRFNHIWLGSPEYGIKIYRENNVGIDTVAFNNIVKTEHMMFTDIATQDAGRDNTHTKKFYDVEYCMAEFINCQPWDYHHVTDRGEKYNVIGTGAWISEVNARRSPIDVAEFPADTHAFTPEEDPAYYLNKYFNFHSNIDSKYNYIDMKLDKMAENLELLDLVDAEAVAQRTTYQTLLNEYTNLMEDPLTQVIVKKRYSGTSFSWKDEAGNDVLVIPAERGINLVRWQGITEPTTNYSSVFLSDDLEKCIRVEESPLITYTVDGDTYIRVDNKIGYTYILIPFVHTDETMNADNMIVTINELIREGAHKEEREHIANKVVHITQAEREAWNSGANSSAKISEHNEAENAHSDIRLLIQGLTTRLNAVANSEDVDLDQLSELVAYIKANRTLIESITTSKVSVTDIVDNLETLASNKPLSAKQGYELDKKILNHTHDATKINVDAPFEKLTNLKTLDEVLIEIDAFILDLYGKIPTKLSQFTDDVGYARKAYATPSMYTGTDTQKIQQAITNNAYVIIPEGDYTISSTISVPEGRKIQIEGKININCAVGFSIKGSNVEICGRGTLNIPSSVATCSAIKVTAETEIKNINIREITMWGVWNYDNSNNHIGVEFVGGSAVGSCCYVNIDCYINCMTKGVWTHKATSQNADSWLSQIDINSTIQNCYQAFVFDWGGDGSRIRGVIQPKVTSKVTPHSKDAPLCVLPRTSYMDAMLWDLDTAINRYAVQVLGKNCTINSYIYDQTLIYATDSSYKDALTLRTPTSNIVTKDSLTESWVFTLYDESTVTKKVVLV